MTTEPNNHDLPLESDVAALTSDSLYPFQLIQLMLMASQPLFDKDIPCDLPD